MQFPAIGHTSITDVFPRVSLQLRKYLQALRMLFKPAPAAPVKRAKRTKRVYEDGPVMYTTIGALLGDLDTVFENMNRMRPKRHSMQKVIKKYGPFIAGDGSEDELFNASRLSTGFKAYGLPSFIILNWTLSGRARISKTQKERDHYMANHSEVFFCAVKHDRVAVFKKPGCAYYEVAYVVGFNDKKEKPFEVFFYVEVDKTLGTVKALKTPQMVQKVIPPSRYCKERSTFYQKEWRMPDLIDDDKEHSEEECQSHLESTFCLSYNMLMKREYGVNIIVKKGKHRATFTVPQDRWKYFFKDRIKVKTPTGHTKPIYHSVSAHGRKTKKGITPVKTHYRGVRHFWWEGYEIRIVMQGKHALSQAEFDLGATDGEDIPPGAEYVPIDGSVSKQINASFEG